MANDWLIRKKVKNGRVLFQGNIYVGNSPENIYTSPINHTERLY